MWKLWTAIGSNGVVCRLDPYFENE